MRLPFLRTGRISPHTGYSAPRVFLFYFTDFPLSRFSSCLPVDIYTLGKTHTPSLLLLDGVEKHIPPLFNILFRSIPVRPAHLWIACIVYSDIAADVEGVRTAIYGQRYTVHRTAPVLV